MAGGGVTFSSRDFVNDERHSAKEFRASRRVLSRTSSKLVLCADVVLVLAAYWYDGAWLSGAARLLLVVALVVVAYMLASHVGEERITIIAGLGVELKTYYSLGMCKTRFLGDGSIQAILVHEAIRGSQVHYSLAFVVLAEKRLVLCFRHVYPGLASLRTVYDCLTRGRRHFAPQTDNRPSDRQDRQTEGVLNSS